MNQINEKDWKLLRKRIPGWQEAYMDRLNREYVELLECDQPASIKFWALDKRLREDKKKTGVAADMRRSRMNLILASLLAEGAITTSDLEGFSEELIAQVKCIAFME